MQSLSTMAPMSRPPSIYKKSAGRPLSVCSCPPSRPSWFIEPIFMDVGEKTRPIPYRDTSNEAYGKYYYGWQRSFLPSLPSVVKNKDLEQFAQQLETSNDAYGYFLRESEAPSRFNRERSAPVSGVPHYYPLRGFEDKSTQLSYSALTRRRPCPARQATAGIIPGLQDVIEDKMNNIRAELEDKLKKASAANAELAASLGGNIPLKLPDIKNIDLNLRLKDDTTVTVRSVPLTDHGLSLGAC